MSTSSNHYVNALRIRQKESPDNPAAAFELAVCLWQSDTKEALDWFLLAATLDPKDNFWKEDAQTRLNLKFDRSTDLLTQLQALAYSQAGLLLRQLCIDKDTLEQNIDQITCYYKQALRLNPTLARPIYSQLVLWYIDCERWADAVNACEVYFSLVPTEALHSGNYHSYALSLLKVGDIDKAQRYATEGIRAQPNETFCWTLLIEILTVSGNEAEAKRVSGLLEKRGKGHRKPAEEIEVP